MTYRRNEDEKANEQSMLLLLISWDQKTCEQTINEKVYISQRKLKRNALIYLAQCVDDENLIEAQTQDKMSKTLDYVDTIDEAQFIKQHSGRNQNVFTNKIKK